MRGNASAALGRFQLAGQYCRSDHDLPRTAASFNLQNGADAPDRLGFHRAARRGSFELLSGRTLELTAGSQRQVPREM